MRVVALGLALALLSAPAGAPAAAHPLPHGDAPRLLDLEPAPGAVVSGNVTIRALVVATQPVTAHGVLVNGEDVTSSAGDGDHVSVSAQVRLEPGTHTVRVSATTAAGTSDRQWRFTVSPLRVGRLAGADRVETAVRISAELYPDGGSAGAAVLARADAFPDALAGVPLAHAVGGPLLLTRSSQLSEPTEQELRRVLPAGATVYLLGGEGALAPRVVSDLRALGLEVERLAGENRYETAVEIARRLPGADHAMLASGEDFADALAASSPAAIRGYPVLLSRPASLPEEVRDYVTEQGLRGVHLIGGAAAIGPAVRAEVRSLVEGMSQTAGATRFETAAAVGQRFFPEAEVVTLASGASFPDALAGGVLAALHGAPMLLAGATRVFNPQLSQIGSLQPGRALVLGGQAALGTPALYDLLRGVVDRGGPLLTDVLPAGSVTDLDDVTLTFDRTVDAATSTVYVTVDGHEVAGTVSGAASGRAVVFSVSELPDFEPDRAYAGRVVASAAAGDGTTRHVEHRFTYRVRPPELRPGDSGPEIADLQRRLRDAGYWVGAIDGRYGGLTVQAVMALEKVHGLPRDGVYDEEPRRILESNPARPRPRTGPGDGLYYEVDLVRQVLMRVVDGDVTWIFNTSTGHGRWYWFRGEQYRANTTVGNHRIAFQRDYPHEAERGLLWRPKYYDTLRGIAIHGSASVPSEPASAGCIRVTNAAMDFIWSLDPAPAGRVLVHPAGYYD
jgi:putative cell wall-binding protein